jgi:hypothetical protein
LNLLLANYIPSPETCIKIHTVLLEKLKASVICGQLSIQPSLLDLLSKISNYFQKTIEFDDSKKETIFSIMKIAFSTPINRECLSYWIHFMTIQIPIIKVSFQNISLILQQICKEICKLSVEFNENYKEVLTHDCECLIFLHGLEWLLRYMLNDLLVDPHIKSGWLNMERKALNPEQNEFVPIIPDLVGVLLVVYDAISKIEMEDGMSQPGVQRIIRIMDILYNKYPRQTIESIIEDCAGEKCYQFLLLMKNVDSTIVCNQISVALKFRVSEKLEYIASTSNLLCTLKISVKKRTTSPDFTNLVLFVNSRCSNAISYKYIFPQIIKVIDAYFEAKSFVTDARMMKDAEDIYCKVLDFVILLIARYFDQGIWKKSAFNEDEIIVQSVSARRETSVEFGLIGRKLLPEPVKEDAFVAELLHYFSEVVIVNLKSFIEPDKYLPVLTNFVNLVCTPCLKKTSSSPLTPNVITIMIKMSTLNAVKIWKKDVYEWFCDSKFFFLPSKQYQKLIETLFSIDTEKFTELLTKREHEITNQYMSLRRISFVILSEAHNFYRQNIPSILAKLSEVFKSNHSILRAEALFVIACLFLRVDAVYLQIYWPTILYHLLDIFSLSTFQGNLPTSRGDIHLLHQASVLLVLIDLFEIDEFQWNKWIFVGDGLGVVDLLAVDLQIAGDLYFEIWQVLARKWDTKDKLTQCIESLFEIPIRQ